MLCLDAEMSAVASIRLKSDYKKYVHKLPNQIFHGRMQQCLQYICVCMHIYMEGLCQINNVQSTYFVVLSE